MFITVSATARERALGRDVQIPSGTQMAMPKPSATPTKIKCWRKAKSNSSRCVAAYSKKDEDGKFPPQSTSAKSSYPFLALQEFAGCKLPSAIAPLIRNPVTTRKRSVIPTNAQILVAFRSAEGFIRQNPKDPHSFLTLAQIETLDKQASQYKLTKTSIITPSSHDHLPLLRIRDF
jgi:hypothetical protein